MQKTYNSLHLSVENTKASMRKHRAKQLECLKYGVISSASVAREKHVARLAAHLRYLIDVRDYQVIHVKESIARMEEIGQRAKHHPFDLAQTQALFTETAAWQQEASKMMDTASLVSIE